MTKPISSMRPEASVSRRRPYARPGISLGDFPTGPLAQDATWRDDVVEAVKELGGQGYLDQIYASTEKIRRGAGRSIPVSFEAVVRRTLEENSSDSESYKDLYDLFYMVEGRGAGKWGLRR